VADSTCVKTEALIPRYRVEEAGANHSQYSESHRSFACAQSSSDASMAPTTFLCGGNVLPSHGADVAEAVREEAQSCDSTLTTPKPCSMELSQDCSGCHRNGCLGTEEAKEVGL
jgi:hypothetical protein